MNRRADLPALVCAALLAGCGARGGLRVPTDLEDEGPDGADAARDARLEDATLDQAPDATDAADATDEDAVDEEAGPDVVEEDAVDEEAGLDVVEEPPLVDARPDLTIAIPVCNQLTTAGNRTPITNEVSLGRTSGSFLFEYDARMAPDNFVVSYEGVVLFDSGCVRGTGSARLMYAGRSRNVTIEVHPNCEGRANTSWTFTAHCPD